MSLSTDPPLDWVTRHLGLIASGANVLDLACGRGRHLRWALSHGFSGVGIDRDVSGIADLADRADVEIVAHDLEAGEPWPFGVRQFDAIIVTNYLHRPLLSAIVASVAQDGVLIYETFGVGNERFGKPSRLEFLLVPGELLEAVRGNLVPVAYHHGSVSRPGPSIRQGLLAVGRSHGGLFGANPLPITV